MISVNGITGKNKLLRAGSTELSEPPELRLIRQELVLFLIVLRPVKYPMHLITSHAKGSVYFHITVKPVFSSDHLPARRPQN